MLTLQHTPDQPTHHFPTPSLHPTLKPPSPAPAPTSPTYTVHLLSSTSTTTPFSTPTTLLRPDTYHPPHLPHLISASPLEVYGTLTPSSSVIRIGNGGLGPTGLLRALCDTYIAELAPPGMAIEWVCNHSRYSQVALLANVVDLALTYEREEETRAEKEGWSKTVGTICHDHFILVGPVEDPAGIAGLPLGEAYKKLAEQGRRGKGVYHTRGDGSATMHKEQSLWAAAGVSLAYGSPSEAWYHRHPLPPLSALLQAETSRAYVLNDRATFLLAKNRASIPGLAVFVEGGEVLMNSCKVVVRAGEAREEVLRFVEWLQGGRAQGIVADFGKRGLTGLALFTRKEREEVDPVDELRRFFPPGGR